MNKTQTENYIYLNAALTLDEMNEDGEVNICFLHVVDNSNCQMFRLDENDRSVVTFEQIK